MKFRNIKNLVAKHSPEILAVVGVVGTVASAVLACRATLKLDDVLERHNEQAERIREAEKNESLTDYGHKEAMTDLTTTYFKTGVALVRLYAPAIALGTLSLGMVLKGHDILRKRNAALAAAYAAVDDAYKAYRERFKERFDDPVEAEREDTNLRHGLKSVADENGNIKQVLPSSDGLSEYAVVFGPDNKNWEGSEYNDFILGRIQSMANDTLKAKGRLFLNDVYKLLGFPPTKAGQIVGWVYDPDNPEHVGDNYVDFNAKEIYPETPMNPNGDNPDIFEEVQEPVWLLDFNVDGNVWESM